MKTVGMIGGMSWESTIPYYRIMNETIKARLRGLHSAKLILFRVDFHDIENLQHIEAWDIEAWDEAGSLLAEAAKSLRTWGRLLKWQLTWRSDL